MNEWSEERRMSEKQIKVLAKGQGEAWVCPTVFTSGWGFSTEVTAGFPISKDSLKREILHIPFEGNWLEDGFDWEQSIFEENMPPKFPVPGSWCKLN